MIYHYYMFDIVLTAIFAMPIISGLIIAIWGIRKNKKTGK